MDEFAARATTRLRAIDPLLPDAFPAGGAGRDEGCGARLEVGHGGNLAAFATCRHNEPDPGEIDLSWGMARRFELAPRVVGPDAATALDRLISLWREHLASARGSDGDDTAAVITWPSRDIEGVAALQRHGLRPLAVVAIRPSAGARARQDGASPHRDVASTRQDGSSPRPDGSSPRRDVASPRQDGSSPRRGGRNPRQDGTSASTSGRMPRRAPERDTRIRRAGPADVDTIAAFGAEVARFDAHFSGTPGRAGTLGALHREATRLVAPAASGAAASGAGASGAAASGGGASEHPDTHGQADAGAAPWTWLAERNGEPVGVIATQRPDHAAWIAPMTRLAPVAYTVLGYVSPRERSGGVGAELADCLHAEVDASAVAATLLHYEQLNPYAAPFWSRQGYRPLWTIWEARPASSLR